MIEIVAGLAVLTSFTRLSAYVVMAWLILIAITLVLAGHLDIAVRDLATAVGAYLAGQAAGNRGEQWMTGLRNLKSAESCRCKLSRPRKAAPLFLSKNRS